MSDAMTTNTTNPRLAAQERRRALSQNGGASLAAKQSASAKIAPKSAAMGADAASGHRGHPHHVRRGGFLPQS